MQRTLTGTSITPLAERKVRALLEGRGIRLTRQRLGIAHLLFGGEDFHFTADVLLVKAHEARIFASLATVYNILNLFVKVGLLRSFSVGHGKTFFDTNVGDHCHLYFEDTGEVRDLPFADFIVTDDIPEGFEVDCVNVIVAVRPRGSRQDTNDHSWDRTRAPSVCSREEVNAPVF